MIFGWKGRGEKRIAAIVRPEALANAIQAAASKSLQSLKETAGPDELAAFAICVDDNILSPYMVGCTRAWFAENAESPQRAMPVEWPLSDPDADLTAAYDLLAERETAREAEEPYFIDRFEQIMDTTFGAMVDGLDRCSRGRDRAGGRAFGGFGGRSGTCDGHALPRRVDPAEFEGPFGRMAIELAGPPGKILFQNRPSHIPETLAA